MSNPSYFEYTLQETMKNSSYSWPITFLFLLMLTAVSCRTLSIKKDYQRLAGSWKEEWGSEDVQYNDVYQIAYLGGDKLAVTCKGRANYIISGVGYDGKHLRMQVEIRDNKYQTGSANIQYDLKLLKSPLLLSGTAINHENKTIPVKWIKQE